ncbi:MAG: diaminopimelate epimerase [Planctomycetota bacterium]
MRNIPFVKMHGLGNDYVYVDERELATTGLPVIDGPERWARILADRHRGIGGDGLIILRRDPDAAVRMEMYNADGSRAEMCGNGIRCVARLAWERGYSDRAQFVVASDAGPRVVVVDPNERGPVGQVRVDMGVPVIEEASARLDVDDHGFSGTVISVGNPHFVIELDVDPASFPVAQFGPRLETHARFPRRANIEFVQRVSASALRFRVWERGSGETQACGTGATAAVAALHARGRVANHVTVHLLGGDLTIDIDLDGRAWMTGPAAVAFRGSFPSELVGIRD